MATSFAGRRTRSWPSPSPSRFALLVIFGINDVIVHLIGELRAEDTAALEECFITALRESPRQLVVDLESLDGSDDSGIECIRTARHLAAQRQIGLVLNSPDRAILARLTYDGANFESR